MYETTIERDMLELGVYIKGLYEKAKTCCDILSADCEESYLTNPDAYAEYEDGCDAVDPWDGDVDDLMALVEIAESTYGWEVI